MQQIHDPWLTLKELEELLGCPREHLEFSLWYLRENQSIQRADNGRYVITAQGVDIAEAKGDFQPLAPGRMLPAPTSPPYTMGHATMMAGPLYNLSS